MGVTELDPRWEWHELQAWGEAGPIYHKGACRHLEVEPVESASGEIVAGLCRTCDAQLPPPGRSA